MVQLTADLSESIPSLFVSKEVCDSMHLCGEFFILLLFFRMKLLRFPRKSVFVWRTFSLGVLLCEGKQTQWLAVCLNALSETFQNWAVFYQWLTHGLLLDLNVLILGNDEGELKVKPKGNHYN